MKCIKASLLANSDEAKACVSTNNHNNIFKEQPIQIADILAIKFYTQMDEQQRAFRKSFRKISEKDTDREVIRRHIKEYYHWGKCLHHAITVYGETINNKTVAYYHGLKGQFMFSSLKQDFNIPTSVTTDITVAERFSGVNGIVLQLKCQWEYDSKWNRSKALSVEWIKKTQNEKEVLLFGNFNQLMIANVYLINNRMMDMSGKKLTIESIINFEQLCNGHEVEYDDEKHAIELKQLIENDVNNVCSDYSANLFHYICENRTKFAIKMFIKYQSDW
eukprot:727535_1